MGILVKDEAFPGYIPAALCSCRSVGAGSPHRMVQEGDFIRNSPEIVPI